MQQLVTPRDVNLQTNHYKTIFLSDIHLGSRACQADLLLDFLKYNDGEKIYLGGDIVDGGASNAVGIGRNHTMTLSKKSCVKRAKEQKLFMCREIMMRVCGVIAARILAALRCA
jgi:hypothetical protein